MINFYKSIPNGPFHHGWEMGVLNNKLKDVLSSEWCSIYTTMTIKYLWNKSQNSSSDVELFEGWINNWIINSLIGQAFFLAREVIFNVSMSGWVCQNTCANATKKKGWQDGQKGYQAKSSYFSRSSSTLPTFPCTHVLSYSQPLDHALTYLCLEIRTWSCGSYWLETWVLAKLGPENPWPIFLINQHLDFVCYGMKSILTQIIPLKVNRLQQNSNIINWHKLHTP